MITASLRMNAWNVYWKLMYFYIVTTCESNMIGSVRKIAFINLSPAIYFCRATLGKVARRRYLLLALFIKK
jgi:hypothetical protein